MNTSHGMYSCVNKREDSKKSVVISLGAIDVDIPQHPVALHCMMTRSSKTLSKQLSEIQSQRTVMRYLTFNAYGILFPCPDSFIRSRQRQKTGY